MTLYVDTMLSDLNMFLQLPLYKLHNSSQTLTLAKTPNHVTTAQPSLKPRHFWSMILNMDVCVFGLSCNTAHLKNGHNHTFSFAPAN